MPELKNSQQYSINDKKKSKNLQQENSTHKVNNIKDTTSAPNVNFIVKDHTNSIGDNDDENIKDHIGIIALIAIMEVAAES